MRLLVIALVMFLLFPAEAQAQKVETHVLYVTPIFNQATVGGGVEVFVQALGYPQVYTSVTRQDASALLFLPKAHAYEVRALTLGLTCRATIHVDQSPTRFPVPCQPSHVVRLPWAGTL